MAASVVNYSNVARPYRSLSPRTVAGIVTAMSLPLLLISILFALAGAWLVLPFAGLELLLAAAFHYVNRHAGDYQSITISQTQLTVENHQLDRTSQFVFHPYWTQVVLRPARAGEQRLWLRSHGREVEVGYYLSNEQRLNLAQQLKIRMGSFH